MAVIQFATNVGNTVGWMGLSRLGHNGPLNTAGYPGDKTSGTQWWMAASITDTNVADKLIQTTALDIIPGQSGSPAWELRTDGSRYIKGIVSHHSCSSGRSADNRTCVTGYNGIVQLDSTHFNNILAWR
jgi:V8-like Glu-specific endopeptidase